MGAFITCLIVASFPGKAAGESVENEKNASSQTSNLTQTNDYPNLRLSKDLFKRYLENPYPVRKVVFFKTFSRPEDAKDAGGPLNVFLYEGSLQPDTFYTRQLTTPKVLEGGKFKNGSDGKIAGKSSTGEYWVINDAASRGKGGDIRITKADVPDTSAMTGGKFRALESLPTVRGTCWFGLGRMVPHTLVWHGDSFDMQWYNSQYPHDTNAFTVNGEVLAYTNNLPLVIRLKFPSLPGYQWADMNYMYDFSQKDRFYPVSMTCEIVFTGNKRLQGDSYCVQEIEFGDAKMSESGYTTTNFTPSNIAIPADVYIASTQGEYWINGKQFVTVGLPPTPKHPLFLITPFVRILLIVLMILPGIFLILWRKKIKN